MKFKTICVSIAIATSMTTGVVFVPQAHVLAQTQPTNSKESRSLEIQWLLGFIPWPTWARNSNNYNKQNKPELINTQKNKSKLISTKKGYNHKEVPVPILIPGLAVLGTGLIRKHRQEQKQIEMK